MGLVFLVIGFLFQALPSLGWNPCDDTTVAGLSGAAMLAVGSALAWALYPAAYSVWLPHEQRRTK